MGYFCKFRGKFVALSTLNLLLSSSRGASYFCKVHPWTLPFGPAYGCPDLRPANQPYAKKPNRFSGENRNRFSGPRSGEVQDVPSQSIFPQAAFILRVLGSHRLL